MNELKALIFDVDGTLADNEQDGHRIAFNLAFADAGLDWSWDREMYAILLETFGGKERILRYIEDFKPAFEPPGGRDRFIRALHQQKTNRYQQLLNSGSIPLRPGVARLLKASRQAGLRLAVASTTTLVAPNQHELTELVHAISHRVAGFLEREGILERDEENSYLNLDDADEAPMQQVLGCSVSYRIAVGPQQGRKVFTLQTIPAWEDDDRFSQVAKASGFSLHAGVAAQAWERQKLERLCRYISRPAVSEKRLSLTSSGNIRYKLKTPYNDGTTHVIFEPLDFMYRMYGMPRAQGCAGAATAKLAALVPKPRVNLTRFHGVFAPNSKHRALVTPARRGRGSKPQAPDEAQDQTQAERRAAMTWAQRLKRVFNIDIETCSECGGAVKVIACIEDPVVIKKILTHLKEKAAPEPAGLLPSVRAPPPVSIQRTGRQVGLFD